MSISGSCSILYYCPERIFLNFSIEKYVTFIEEGVINLSKRDNK